MKQTIYEIENNIQEAIYMLEESDGELTPEIEELLEINRNNLTDKINQYHYCFLNLKSKNEVLEEEIKRLQSKIIINENSIQQIKVFVNKAVKLYGLQNTKSTAKTKPVLVDTGLVKAVVSYSESIEIDDRVNHHNLPDELIPFTKMELKILLPFDEYQDKLILLIDSEKDLSRITSKIANISKSEIKTKIGEGIVFHSAIVKINEKTDFK